MPRGTSGGWFLSFGRIGALPQAGLLALRPGGVWNAIVGSADVYVFLGVLLGSALWPWRSASKAAQPTPVLTVGLARILSHGGGFGSTSAVGPLRYLLTGRAAFTMRRVTGPRLRCNSLQGKRWRRPMPLTNSARDQQHRPATLGVAACR